MSRSTTPISLTLLGALSAWTDRVGLVTTVVVPQLHDPVMLAKGLATGDMLSGGRLTVGIGVGGRHEDYTPSGPTPRRRRCGAGRPGGGDEAGVGRREGHRVRRPVGPLARAGGRTGAAHRHDGPEDRAQRGGMGRGLAGTTLDLDVGKQNELFDVARDAWAQAGKRSRIWRRRSGSPSATTPRGHGQVHRHLRRYMNWIPPRYVDAMAPTTGWAGRRRMLEVLGRFEDIGTDEVHLIPTSSDVDQVRRVAELAKQFG